MRRNYGGHCSGCIRYDTPADAAKAIEAKNNKHGAKRRSAPVKHYPCGHCKGWHIGSIRPPITSRGPSRSDR